MAPPKRTTGKQSVVTVADRANEIRSEIGFLTVVQPVRGLRSVGVVGPGCLLGVVHGPNPHGFVGGRT